MSVVTLALAALAAPAIIIAVICLVVVPGTSGGRSFKATRAWRRKLWEMYAALTGLALAVAVAFFITQGLKVVFGKPRPHLLAVCNPDLANIQSHIVGGYGQSLDIRWSLVNSTICQTTDLKNLKDSFQSFPSGHCSFSWSGLLYLSLFLCAKFSITIPYLPLQPMVPLRSSIQLSPDAELLPLHRHAASSSGASTSKDPPPPLQTSQPNTPPILYNQAAAPPTYGILLALIPMGAATYIASTRYTDYYHDGFDVISGSLIGIVTAIFSFYWYHLPITRGRGWAWRSRSADRAFGIGMGVGSYIGPAP